LKAACVFDNHSGTLVTKLATGEYKSNTAFAIKLDLELEFVKYAVMVPVPRVGRREVPFLHDRLSP